MIKKLLREGLIQNKLNEDVKNFNQLYVYLKEEMDFDPFAHGKPASEEEVDKNICFLSFSKANAKLDWPYFSLPAGYTCPSATSCKSFAAKPGTKFKDNTSLKKASDKTEFQCYAARQQAQYKDTNKKVFSNLSLLMNAQKSDGSEGMANLIIDSIKYAGLENYNIFRIHESGDFFSDSYFKAWIRVANEFPNIKFYTHTTSLNFWINNKSSVPSNMNLIASMDKNNEEMILQNNLRYVKVVYSIEEAKRLRLPIDYDDSLACCSDVNFALLLHGGQPAGTEASKAYVANKKSGAYEKIKDLQKANKGNRQDLLRK
jgi:hypothetical protein